MGFRWGWTALILAAALARPPVAWGAEADPFTGKSLDEIKRILETRMEERKKDRDFAASYQSFYSKQERELVRWGARLAADARAKSGEYTQAELLFRFGQPVESLKVLLPYEKRLSKARQARNYTLIMVYRLTAVSYAWLDKIPEAMISLGDARKCGDMSGGPLNKIQKDVCDLPALRQDLAALRKKRNLEPRQGDKEWALCEFFQQKIFSPLEEFLELSWMSKTFPDHPKVKSGDAGWALIAASEKLFDVRQIPKLAEDFRKSFPDHWAQRQGDLQWMLSKAYFGAGNYKEAKKAAEQLKRQFPKFRMVESRETDSFIAACDAAMGSKTPPTDEGDAWNHWWDWP